MRSKTEGSVTEIVRDRQTGDIVGEYTTFEGRSPLTWREKKKRAEG